LVELEGFHTEDLAVIMVVNGREKRCQSTQS
jgi:hypothetical protein